MALQHMLHFSAFMYLLYCLAYLWRGFDATYPYKCRILCERIKAVLLFAGNSATSMLDGQTSGPVSTFQPNPFPFVTSAAAAAAASGPTMMQLNTEAMFAASRFQSQFLAAGCARSAAAADDGEFDRRVRSRNSSDGDDSCREEDLAVTDDEDDRSLSPTARNDGVDDDDNDADDSGTTAVRAAVDSTSSGLRMAVS